MSKTVKQTITCEECGKDFEVDTYESINVTLNPELKEKILNEDIYEFECPFCHKKHYIPYPFLYHDMEKKFMIFQGDYNNLMSSYLDLVESNSNSMHKVLNKLVSDYKYLGCLSFREFKSKLTMLDNDIDYRVGTIYELFNLINYDTYLEKAHNDSLILNDAFFSTNENGEPVVVFELTKKEDNTQVYSSLPFKKEMYEEIAQDFSEELEKIISFVFDREAAVKFLNNCDDNVNNGYKKDSMELAIVADPNGNKLVSYVPSFNVGKFNVGDVVIMMKDFKIMKVKILNLYKTKEYALPFKIEKLPVITWKTKNIEISTTKNSNEEPGSGDVLHKVLEEYKEKGRLNPAIVSKSNIAVGLKATLRTDIDPTQLKVNDTLSPEMVKTVLTDKQTEDGNYICVYLRQSDIPTDSGISPIIYNFNDFIDVAIQKCGRYQGIVVIDGDNEVVIPFDKLVEYKRNKLVIQKNFLKIAYGLNENEVSFIGELNYKIVKMNLFDDLDDKQIANELGIEEKEAKFGFEKGYNRFNLVIISNYL